MGVFLEIIAFEVMLFIKENSIFSQVVGGRAIIQFEYIERMMLMSTYEEFMVILATASLIVAILNMKNKK